MLDTNDLTLGIRQAQEDINSYYIIGYYSKNDAPTTASIRRIEVKLVEQDISAPSSITATATTPTSSSRSSTPPTRSASLKKR